MIIWFIIKAILITIIWGKILYGEDFNRIEICGFLFLVLIYGMLNEIFVANTDINLLACGFGSYLILDIAQKKADMINNNEMPNNNNSVILLYNLMAGFIFAWGMFKPLLLIYLPILLYKSNKRLLFLSGFCSWMVISNYLLILNPDLIFQYINRIKSGQTIVGPSLTYQTPLFNTIWRSGFTPAREQIYIYPAVIC